MKTETEYDQKATQFLANNGLKLRITRSNTKTAPWQDEKSGVRNHYRVTLSREGGGRVSFDFWGSVNDATNDEDPSAYDVLACISSDVSTPETFEDFCSEFGEDEDSRKALALFKRADRFARKLRAFLTATEIEQLQEVQ